MYFFLVGFETESVTVLQIVGIQSPLPCAHTIGAWDDNHAIVSPLSNIAYKSFQR
jgi:hypothetical protein